MPGCQRGGCQPSQRLLLTSSRFGGITRAGGWQGAAPAPASLWAEEPKELHSGKPTLSGGGFLATLVTA